MHSQREKNSCACCNAVQCKLSTSLNQDFKRKEILQPLIWPTEQSPQIAQFDFDSNKHLHQSPFSCQFQLQLRQVYDGELLGLAQKPTKSSKTHANNKKTIGSNISNHQFRLSNRADIYRPLDSIQSILADDFINIQLMEEEIPEDRLVEKDPSEENNSPALKNANVPKFLIRLFFRYFRTFGELKLQQMDQSIKKFLNDYQQRYTKAPKSFYKLDQLIDILRLQEWTKEKNIVLRQIMNAIIRSKAKSEIFTSSQLRHKVSYLNAAKVYSLRCLNPSLSQRLQSK